MMDQQSTGEEVRKISRSKARHLRRKRLITARRAADSELSLTESETTQNCGLQEPSQTLSKSKARRLRKNKKRALANNTRDSDETSRGLLETENPSELLGSSQSSNVTSAYERADEKLRDPQFNIVDSCDSVHSPSTSLVEEAVSSILDSIFDSDNGKTNGCVESELPGSNKKSQAPPCDQCPDFEPTFDYINTNLQSNQSKKNRDRLVTKNVNNESQVKEKSENKEKLALCGLDSTSHKSRTTPDGDSDCTNRSSSSCSTDQRETTEIQPCDSSKLITETGKIVLNATELIENEKNLKISSCSNSRNIYQPNAAVIDVTSYCGSDLSTDADASSFELGEQHIIADLISNSGSDLDQNHRLQYSNYPEISNTETQSRNNSHRKSVTKNLLSFGNQTSFDLTEDYSLPSTSVINIVSSVTTDSERSCVSKKSEGNMSSVEKSREQVKAEREAKKAAKALAKSKAKAPKSEETTATQSSKDTPTTTDQVTKDPKENIVGKAAVAPEKKTINTETEVARSTGNKENEPDSKIDGKSKRETKAERRAKQEAQRALKEKQGAEKSKAKSFGPPKLKDTPKVSDPVKTTVRKTLVDNNLHEVKLFKHLYHERELSLVNVPILNSNVHPAIVRLGIQYANKVIVGSNARCVALLAAVKQLIEDFERPSQADFTRGLEASLQECAAYLHHCRPMAVSMQNALKYLKWQMTQLPTTMSDDDAKTKLGDAIDTYIREQISLAGEAISNMIKSKISNGDVILTYAFSSLIHNILIDAHAAGKQFRVIVVDGRPWLEGKEQLRRLAKCGIQCSYILINALSFIMPEVSKVFLGAHAILANGAVMSRAGTAQVALMAKAFNVPVLVACETHKSCERVQTDSFVYNEIGDADELARDSSNKSKKSPLLNWKTKKSLDLLNITYDVTPADLVSAVVTELAILPCTSIPVILRIKPSEI